MCCKPNFPRIEGIEILEEGEPVPAGMTVSDEECYHVATSNRYRVAFDPEKVSIVGWSTYDFGPLPEGLVYLGRTGLGGYNLYYKPVADKEYSFPVWGTQGGGLVRQSGEHYIFVEAPDCPGLDVGDMMPKEWDIVAANTEAREADESDWNF